MRMSDIDDVVWLLFSVCVSELFVNFLMLRLRTQKNKIKSGKNIFHSDHFFFTNIFCLLFNDLSKKFHQNSATAKTASSISVANFVFLHQLSAPMVRGGRFFLARPSCGESSSDWCNSSKSGRTASFFASITLDTMSMGTVNPTWLLKKFTIWSQFCRLIFVLDPLINTASFGNLVGKYLRSSNEITQPLAKSRRQLSVV